MQTYSATYSPDDNKLRLYAAVRLSEDEYQRAKACGFRWAPHQKLFVCPAWNPEAEDLCLGLCGEIDDEDTSLVDRAEERAGRFEVYSEKRAAESERAQEAVAAIADNIPLGQPILVGHHSERHARKDAERIENGMRKAIRLWDTSKYWEQRAAGALRHAKYVELPAVRARRIKTLEAERRRLEKSYTPSGPVILDKPIGSCWQVHGHGVECEKCERQPMVFVGHHRGGGYTPVRCLPGIKARAERWLAHVNKRLAYEHAMLGEQGASHMLAPKPKGPAKPPILNYLPASGQFEVQNRYYDKVDSRRAVTMTQAEYARINKDYKGTTLAADRSHRIRCAMVKFELVCVFLSDAKNHGEPKPAAVSA